MKNAEAKQGSPYPTQDPKYGIALIKNEAGVIVDARLCKMSDGDLIPKDEPIMMFRGQDKMALDTINHYWQTCRNHFVDLERAQAISYRYADFDRFATEHPERMKLPDTDAGQKRAETPVLTPNELAYVTDDLKKLMGLPPYDRPDNVVCGDGHFSNSLVKEYRMPMANLLEVTGIGVLADKWNTVRQQFMSETDPDLDSSCGE